MTDKEKLLDIIDRSGLPLTFIAEQLNISRSALYQKLDGKTDFKQDEISKLCDILHITSVMERWAIFFAKCVD